MKVLISVDPHKSVNAVAAIDENGEIISHMAFPADRSYTLLVGFLVWLRTFNTNITHLGDAPFPRCLLPWLR